MRSILKHFFASLSLVLCAGFLQAQTPEGYTWQEIESVNFGTGANHFTIEAASEGAGGEVELRLDAADGPVIGRAYMHHTGGSSFSMEYECDLKQTVSGVHDVYMNFQDYSQPFKGELLKIGDFQFDMVEEPTVVSQERLNIYPPVDGLNPSPYYEFYIQKVSELNSANLADVSNWQTPFAWFTQCSQERNGYFSDYIGGWSHTYTNFEMDPNTPIVVKIVRKDNTGDNAPSGDIISAAVHPAHRVDSWELIDGDVYVTMSNPAQISIDIDGQLDSRPTPRFRAPVGWDGSGIIYDNAKDGAHAVSIFANPFIEDKPNPDDPGVRVVKAGKYVDVEDINNDPSWTTLYFEPGVHRLSAVMRNGELVDNIWDPKDVITLEDNKSYYIPGDAMVYGNFTDFESSTPKTSYNIRMFGHGSISGEKILHWGSWDEYPDGYPTNQRLKAIVLNSNYNVQNARIEGITILDPANHTLTLNGSGSGLENSIRWIKIINWRVNSDGTSTVGNVILEDCFIRAQDDSHYIGGAKSVRRCVYWNDVNGNSFRGDLASARNRDITSIEDCDVLYARGVFGFNDGGGYSAISGKGGRQKIIEGNVINTMQTVYFKDLNFDDPYPVRSFAAFRHESDEVGDCAGVRFENVSFKDDQAWGWKNFIFEGAPKAQIHNFVFDNVTVGGQQFNADYFNNPEKVKKNQYVYDMTYRFDYSIPSTDYTLVTTATNGSVSVDTSEIGEVTVTAVPIEGYYFIAWGGDLSRNSNPATITMDGDKAITAYFSDEAKTFYALSTTAKNGSIVANPQQSMYEAGSEVTLSAVGDLGYGFESWGGDLSGTATSETITMDGDKTISANFTPIVTYALDIDTKYGSVVLDPPGGTYNDGAQVSLTTNPDLGYIFGEWSGDLSGSQSSKTITMDTDKTVSAKFLYAGAGGSSDVAINCKGSQYTSADNVVYEPSNIGSKYATNESISGTEDDELYQSEAFGGSLSYNFALNNGPYEVVLKFAEIFHDVSGKRLFDVSIEDELVLDDFDIVAEAGGKNIALDKTFLITVLDQELNITLSKVLDNAKISAIQIISQSVEVESFTLEVSDPQNGSITIDPVEDTYPAGSEVTLAAVAETGFAFVGWSGDYNGFDNPTDLYMDDNKSVTALFDEAQTYTLTSNITNGEISLSPEGGTYNQLTEVVVSVSPDEGYKFAGWQGDLSGTDNPATIVMNGDKDITALIVEIPTYTLSADGANGNVSIDPLKDIYIEGEQVTITAMADEGYRFEAWSGDYAGSLNPATITIDENKSITAVFEEIPIYTLTTVAANGSITLDPAGGTYEEGTSVSISLSVDEGYRFVGWSGNLSGTQNPATLVMNGDKEVTAQIEEIPSYTLTIAGENGAVSIDPQKDEYEEGEQVTITASADEGYRFGAWSGDLTGSQNPATIIMNGDKSITAKFNMIPVYTLTTTAPNGTITLDPEGGSYQEGTSVTLTLSIDEGYEFVGWLGDYSGMDNPVSIVMNEDKTITAAIVEIPSYSLTVNAENGSVVLDPAGGSYEEGTEVEVTAVPDDGFSFNQWSGNLSGTLNPETIVMDGNKSITAEFDNDTDVKEFENGALMQSYPNPFSDKTTIEYHLSSSEHVKISIYNITGQEVVVLVDREKRSGKHEVIWNAQQSSGIAVPQGLYICRFEAGGVMQTIKVILAK